MTKILALGDLHIGARGGSKYMREFIFNYLCDYVIPYCAKHNIKDIIQTGDITDIRKLIYAMDVYLLQTRLIPALQEHGITMHVIPGNHDIALADSVEISWTNVLQELSGGYIVEYATADDYTIAGQKICMVPWVCRTNLELTKEVIQNSKASVCVGHFEIAGFEMYRGTVSEHGSITEGELKGFKVVKSGHYHTRNGNGFIEYVGTPYHLTWQDYPDGENRGFEVWEMDNNEIVSQEFVPNTENQSVFRVFIYDQSLDANFKKYVDPAYLDKELGFSGQIVRVQVTNREASKNSFNKFVDAMKRCNAIDYMIIDKTELVATSEVTVDEAVLQMDVLQILNDKVERSAGIDTQSVMLKLKFLMEESQRRGLV